LFGVSATRVKQAKKLRREDRTGFDQVKAGTKKMAVAISELKRMDSKETPPRARPTSGRYACLVITPAWSETARSGPNNISATEKTLLNDPRVLTNLQADADIYLEVPPAELPAGLRILERWGCQYRGLLAFSPTTEGSAPIERIVLVAARGDRLEHLQSRALRTEVLKIGGLPDAFYELVRAVGAEPCATMFTAENPAGFVRLDEDLPRTT